MCVCVWRGGGGVVCRLLLQGAAEAAAGRGLDKSFMGTMSVNIVGPSP